MAIAIDCDCGEQVIFTGKEEETAPIRKECECGQEWQLTIQRLYKWRSER